MANVLWTAPAGNLAGNTGTAVTAAALTSGTPQPLPQIPGGTLDPGTELDLEADFEVTSTSATPTVVFSFYIGSVGQAIGSKTLIAATSALAISASETAWPSKVRYRGKITAVGASAGAIRGTGECLKATSLTAWTSTPFPVTQALRTVSTLNTQQTNELDVGITLSSTTGSPSVTCTRFIVVVHG